jgi:hypothetical protein
MCTGLEPAVIAALVSAAGSAVAAGGTMYASNEASKNAERAAAARNKVMDDTLKRTSDLAKDSRDIYKQREAQIAPEAAAASAEDATAARTATLEGAIPDSAPEAVPISGSAPTVVKSEIAQKLLDATGEAKSQARALGKVGGYGDAWFNQGLESGNTERNMSIPQNFIQGELGLMPYSQDFAEYRAYKPSSGIGEIMTGAGNVLASAGGAYAGRKAAAPATGTAPLTGWGAQVKYGA